MFSPSQLLFSLLALQAWSWGSLSFLSPVLSVLTATKYMGELQTVYWSVVYSTVLCSPLGVVMGYTWEYKYLQLLCVFLGILIINKCESWTPLAKVFGALCYMLGVLLPTVTGGDSTKNSLQVCIQLILVTNVPILITGVSLLLPQPMLSLDKCQEVVASLCNKLSITTDSLVDAFLFPDQADLYSSMANQYMIEAGALLDSLRQLQSTLKKESFLFSSLRPINRKVASLIPLLSDMLDNLRALHEIGQDISPNRTQEMFVTLLQSPLQRFQEAMHVLLEEVIVAEVCAAQCCAWGRGRGCRCLPTSDAHVYGMGSGSGRGSSSGGDARDTHKNKELHNNININSNEDDQEGCAGGGVAYAPLSGRSSSVSLGGEEKQCVQEEKQCVQEEKQCVREENMDLEAGRGDSDSDRDRQRCAGEIHYMT